MGSARFCGYAASVVNGQPNGKRYVYCGGRKHHICHESKGGLTFDEIEEEVEEKLVEYAKTLKYETERNSNINLAEINSLKAEKIKLEEQLDRIADNFAEATTLALQRKLNEKSANLEKQIEEIESKLAKLSVVSVKEVDVDVILPLLDGWDNLELEDKKAIAKLLITRVTVYDDKTPIEVEFAV